MHRIALPALALVIAIAPQAQAKQPKPGLYGSRAACLALAKQDPRKRLDTEAIMDGAVQGPDAAYLTIETKRIGSIDFECTIGKPRKAGTRTEWPLACQGESSGGPTSTMRQKRPGTLDFTGGLKGWGQVRFCR